MQASRLLAERNAYHSTMSRQGDSASAPSRLLAAWGENCGPRMEHSPPQELAQCACAVCNCS